MLFERLLRTAVTVSHNQLYTWGDNSVSELGNQTLIKVSSPVQVGIPYSWSQLSSGQNYTMAIRSDKTLWAWGFNSSGQLGIATGAGNFSSPVAIPSSSTASWSTISGNNLYSLGIKSDGTLWGWGLNTSGQVGIASLVNASSPVLVSGPATTSWSYVSAGVNHALAITSLGRLYGWGLNTSGQVGIASLTTVSSPVLVSGPAATSWSSVSAGNIYSLGITTTGLLYGWGFNTSGQVGIASLTTVSSPVLVSGPATTSWSSVSAGYVHSLGITTTGLLYGWGLNTSGQVGIASLTTVSSPVLVSGPATTSWSSVSAGNNFSLGITSTGLLYGWGLNTSGQVGINSLTTVSSPVAVTAPVPPITTSFSLLAAGDSHSFGIYSNSLYAWGNNNTGQLGNSSLVSTSSPVLIPGTWSTVTAGVSFSLGITTAGRLYAWGLNTFGQLGTNSTTNTSSPVLVSGPATTSWSSVSAGANHALAITSTGLLYGWGQNISGQVGINSTTNISSPVLVSGPATTSWSSVAAGGSFSTAITTTGQLYTWGQNTSGQLGNNTSISTSSPVLITAVQPTINWNTRLNNFYSGGTKNWYVFWGVSSTPLTNYTINVNLPFGNSTSVAAIAISGANTTNPFDNDVLLPVSYYNINNIASPTINYSTDSSNNLILAVNDSAVAYLPSGFTNITTNNYFSLGYNIQSTPQSNTSINFPFTYTDFAYADAITQAPGQTLSIDSTTIVNLISAGTIPVTINTSNSNDVILLVIVTLSGFNNITQLPVSWNAIESGFNHCLAIDTNNYLWSWGNNSYGQVGDGTTNNRSSPVLLDKSHTWLLISAGTNYSVAMENTSSKGTLWAWGSNASNQLVGLSNSSVSSPTALRAPPKGFWYTTLAAGYSHVLASTDVFSSPFTFPSASYGWGSNTSGQVGINAVSTVVSSPTVIYAAGTTPVWQFISAGNVHSIGIASGGSNVLYAWGLNTSGQLGNSTITTVSSPVVVIYSSLLIGNSGTISAGSSHSLAVTSTGLYGWGDNASAEAGIQYVTSPTQVGTSSWSYIASGTNHSLGITTAGVLYSWGDNTGGELGNYSVVKQSSPVAVSAPSVIYTWSKISSGGSHSIAIRSDGTLWAWGFNTSGQLGNLSVTTVNSPVLVSGPPLASWSSISAGISHSIGITTTGLLYAWGANASYQLGVGNTTPVSSPILVSGPATTSWSFIATSEASQHNLAISTTGLLYGWGVNTSGQVGNSSITTPTSPVLVSGPATTSWSVIAAGGNHSLGITSTGRLYAWGLNTSGQVGVATLTTVSSPVLVSGPATTSWRSIAGGGIHSLAITTTGILYGWGLNTAGQVGNASLTTVSSPVLVSGPATTSWSSVAAGSSHSFGITTIGQLYGWGQNTSGQVGINSLTTVSSPVLVSGPVTTSWSAISGGASHSNGILSTGLLYGWGLNTSGQVGIASLTTVSSPVVVYSASSTPFSWTIVSAGTSFSLGITTNGVLYGWGLNTSGQVGIASLTSISSPVLVSGPTTASWTSVSAGATHSLGITTIGQLYAWGLNTSGQVGIASLTTVSSPVLVSGPATTSWSSVAGGGVHSLGITTIGQLYAWGLNTSGQVGIASLTTVSSPVLVSGPATTSWSSVTAGSSYSLGITSAGRLYGWGQNTSGQVGINSLTTVSSPVLVSGPTSASWIAVNAGPASIHTVSIKT